MKKFLFALAAGVIPALAATNGAYAQNSVNTEQVVAQKNVSADENVAGTVNDNSLLNISPRALKDFTKTYKKVYGENWQKTNEGFTAGFTSDGVKSMVFYNNKGRWAGILKGYNEDKMPADLRRIVKREYYDYMITFVQELQTIDSEGKPTYIVHLEDKKNIIQLRICDGQMEVWKEFQKQQ